MSRRQELSEAIQRGDRNAAKTLVSVLLEEGAGPGDVLESLVSGMDVVGRRFKANEVFVPEVLIAARAMKEAMALLEPHLVKAGIKPQFTAVIGTVEGDLHDIGKNLVAMMWRGANIGVVDLGTNVPVQRFVDAAREHHARIIGLSALLTTTMPAMKQAVEAIRAAGLDDVRVLIGGAPVTESFAQQIGADGYAADAASAVDKARELCAA